MTAGRKTAENTTEIEQEGQIPIQESTADLQSQDPVGPILRLRLRQSDQPRPEEVLSESEAAKVLWGLWHSLVLRDGVLYRELIDKYGRPTTLQVVVPEVKKAEFI